MNATNSERIDVEAIRQAHPIQDVIASSGVQLHAQGHGYMGCCPFHDDKTASMSVAGVPDRFKCFGCDVGGDVIEYVSRRYNLSFSDSIAALQNRTLGSTAVAPQPGVHARPTIERDLRRISVDRAYEINQMAWEHFAAPQAAQFAQSHLASKRSIDLVALREFSGGAPVVGYAGTGWTSLINRLHDKGISGDELLATDLAQLTRNGRLVDTYRGRIIIPVANSAGQINGFVGRDVTGGSHAPKYRNPTRTTTFNKSMTLYRPTHHGLAADANVVIVEGVLDALAIAAAAARQGRMDRFAPCSTSGVTVSHEQVCRVLALHPRPPVIALDGDHAGIEGTSRWLSSLCLDSGRPALVTTLPTGTDPAEWLAGRGDPGLTAFDRRGCLRTNEYRVRPSLPGRELVQLIAERHSQPVPAVLTSLVPIAQQLPTGPATQLLRDVEHEMTQRGWNPNGSFSRALIDAVAQVKPTSASQAIAANCPHPHLTTSGIHNCMPPDSPCVS
jgi:DNA primase